MTYGFQSINPDGFLVRTKDGRNCILQEDLIFVSRDGNTYKLPIGAGSDGASTPAFLWPSIPPFGTFWQAAYLHDCAYRDTLLVLVTPTGQWVRATLPKARCDALLEEAMEYAGTGDVTRWDILKGVEWGGESSFESDRADGNNVQKTESNPTAPQGAVAKPAPQEDEPVQ